MAAMEGILVRVRSQLGMWRVSNVDPHDACGVLMKRIDVEHNVPVHQQQLSTDPAGSNVIDPSMPLAKVGVSRSGDMLYLKIDSTASALVNGPEMPTGKKIAADGSIVTMTFEESTADAGFRPGMPRLRDLKNNWTLTDFLEMDDKFVYKIKKQDEAMCTSVTMDHASAGAFTQYLSSFGWRQQRVGYLYGTFEEDNSVLVHAVYEPPQECTAESFELLEDPRAEQVERLADMLGMKRVGWIFAHPPREEGFMFSAEEVMFAAMEQLEAAQGVDKTPFVTIRCTVDPEDGNASVDPFQVSLQCMDMVAEGALGADPDNRSSVVVSPTFTAIKEGKRAETIESQFFLLTIAIKDHTSPILRRHFPMANRIGTMQTTDELKDLLSNPGGKSITECLSDFALLLFLMDFQDMFNWETDMPRICEAVKNPDAELDEGYAMIIKGFAGMDV
mmetsp:Transcript_12717/g.26720  ORF Transcript_12717/g.26720 Transcript_12717/m.26720 type:complete len:446 (-) Transcript_12717:155-1492(-)|eukprot:CAMPEP_0182532190 /NCGR_PEP_ID=MMETSP1323-20130603/10997_1 /TAXON_ID=236787 /ORGANISM="Florenciella parvula, Strain RCC1693" /LENGTH=445 /DNA_ID=CAMNT_0024741885 /DNA_START=106 /DNA_END=1443 /DNA_ORIENTATION=+